jgi:hypothetical protein
MLRNNRLKLMRKRLKPISRKMRLKVWLIPVKLPWRKPFPP